MILNLLRRVRLRLLDVRIEIGLTIQDLLDARHKTFERRKRNVELRAGAKCKEVCKPVRTPVTKKKG